MDRVVPELTKRMLIRLPFGFNDFETGGDHSLQCFNILQKRADDTQGEKVPYRVGDLVSRVDPGFAQFFEIGFKSLDPVFDRYGEAVAFEELPDLLIQAL